MDAEALEGITRRQNLQLLYLSDGRVKPGAFESRVPGFKCHHYHPLPQARCSAVHLASSPAVQTLPKRDHQIQCSPRYTISAP